MVNILNLQKAKAYGYLLANQCISNLNHFDVKFILFPLLLYEKKKIKNKQLNEGHNKHYLHILPLLASPVMLRFVLSGKNIID